MAIAHGATAESHTGTTGSASEASFGWTHAGGVAPKGFGVFVMTGTDADFITSVNIGGADVPAVTNGEAVDTAGQPRRCTAFFLGSSIPTGNQTVTVVRTNNATVMYAISFHVTADAAATEIKGTPVLLNDNGTLAEVNVDAGAGVNAIRYGGVASGLDAVPTAGASSTLLHDIDLGTNVHSGVVETTPGTGSRPVGFVAATDNRAAVHIAIGEVVTFVPYPHLHGMHGGMSVFNDS
jgi:hypothetical protein